MKKQLLTALLALTPLFATAKPSFAPLSHKASEGKQGGVYPEHVEGAGRPTNAELLVHLKNVRTDIKQHIFIMPNIEKLPKYIVKEKFEFSAKLIRDIHNFVFLSKLIKDIHNVLPLADFLYGKNTNITQLYFEEICKMKQFDDIDNEIDYESLIYANRASKEKIDIAHEMKLISPIFMKHHKSYCSKHPQGYFKKLCVSDLLTIQLFNDIDLFKMFVLLSTKYILNDVLQKIDAKIAELEKQI